MYQVFTIVAGSADPQGVLETPTHNAAASQPVTVSGWAIDAGTTSGTGVNAVEVYHCLYSNCSPTWTDAGAATYGGSRSDVAATYGPPFLNSSYSKSLSGLTPGPYAVFSYAHSTVSDTWRVLSALSYLDQGTSTLTIDRQGVGTGGVSATGLTCSGGSTTQSVPCSAGYTFNTEVTLTAVPDTGSDFGGWTGACTGTSTCTVTMAGAKYVAATFLPVAPNQGLTFYHTDMIGSVRALTDGSGTTITRHDYGAFGEDTASMTGDPLRFGGKELDPETAMENFEARYYRQTWGRFSQVDPVSGWTTDPQSWNRYAYARNNPLKYVDPTGTEYSVCLNDFGCQSASQIQLDELCYGTQGFSCDGDTMSGSIWEYGSGAGYWVEGASFRDGDSTGADNMAWGGGSTLLTSIDEGRFVQNAFAAVEQQRLASDAEKRAEVVKQLKEAGLEYLIASAEPHKDGFQGPLANAAAAQGAIKARTDDFIGGPSTAHWPNPGWAGREHRDIGPDASDYRSKDGRFGTGSMQINISEANQMIHVDVDRVSAYGPLFGIPNQLAHGLIEYIPWKLGWR